jgi:AGZA family xanthine/uracil permease-like MFS transporter
LLFDWLPRAALFPILVFVGLEITAQSFHATPARHYAALAFAMLPALAQLANILLKSTYFSVVPAGHESIVQLQTVRCLANGFIITSLLWAAALAMLLDGRFHAAALYFAVASVCAFFGIINSPLADEQIALPGQVLQQLPEPFLQAVRYQTPYHWAAAYALVAGLTMVLGTFRAREKRDASDVEFK